MTWAYTTHERDRERGGCRWEIYTRSFRWNTLNEEIILKTILRWEDNIKIDLKIVL
jgi:hypothetical protein